MLEIMKCLPEGAIGLASRGGISRTDCDGTLLPLVADQFAFDETVIDEDAGEFDQSTLDRRVTFRHRATSQDDARADRSAPP